MYSGGASSFGASRRACQGLTAPAVMPVPPPPWLRAAAESPPRSDCPSWALNYSPSSRLSPPSPETPTFYLSAGIHQWKQIGASCEGRQTRWGEFPRAPCTCSTHGCRRFPMQKHKLSSDAEALALPATNSSYARLQHLIYNLLWYTCNHIPSSLAI